MHETYTVIPTGFAELDALLGIGGWPLGYISEVHGYQSCGKTLIALEAAKQALLQGFTIAYMDLDMGLSLEAIREYGVDTESGRFLHFYIVEDFKSVVDYCQQLICSGLVHLLIIDSVLGFRPKYLPLEGDVEEARHEANLIEINEAYESLRNLAYQHKCGVLITNPIRGKDFSWLQTPPDEPALSHEKKILFPVKYWPYARIHLEKIKYNPGKAFQVKATVVKNAYAGTQGKNAYFQVSWVAK